MCLSGLLKGSPSQRRVKSQIFDQLVYQSRNRKRISAPVPYVLFDTLMEGDEQDPSLQILPPGGANTTSTQDAVVRRGGVQKRRSAAYGKGGDNSMPGCHDDDNEEWAKVRNS